MDVLSNYLTTAVRKINKLTSGYLDTYYKDLLHSFIHYRSLTSPVWVLFTRLTPSGPYRTTTCRERELASDHIHTFWTTQGRGGPPRMSDQLNTGATSEKTRKDDTPHSRTHSF